MNYVLLEVVSCGQDGRPTGWLERRELFSSVEAAGRASRAESFKVFKADGHHINWEMPVKTVINGEVIFMDEGDCDSCTLDIGYPDNRREGVVMSESPRGCSLRLNRHLTPGKVLGVDVYCDAWVPFPEEG
tara:strand:- start:212 stop:604 length:393 start_codon:yes stop_codon:yes gene_type:complete